MSNTRNSEHNLNSNGNVNNTSVTVDPDINTPCRFISKTGRCLIENINQPPWFLRYMADPLTTCIDLRWRYTILIFVLLYIASWVIFGLVYYIISLIHLDFAWQQNPDIIDTEEWLRNCTNDANCPNSTLFSCAIDECSSLGTCDDCAPTAIDCYQKLETYKADREADTCFTDIHNFTSAILFSYETQTTIGYGGRHPTEKCPSAVFAVMVQSVLSTIIDAFAIGWIIAKISRPKKRAETLLFSNKAVINMRDGKLCLMVRVGNLRKSVLVEATIRMQFIQSRTTKEGEYIPFEQIDLDIDLGNDSDTIFLVTPQIIVHPIDESSPLYEKGPDALNGDKWEVIVVLEGMVEATGGTTQARVSYLPKEIEWGNRFKNVVTRGQKEKGYLINFSHFHETYATKNPPKHSAKEMKEAEERSDNDSGDIFQTRARISHAKFDITDSPDDQGSRESVQQRYAKRSPRVSFPTSAGDSAVA